jgi:serine/threonine protein kinase
VLAAPVSRAANVKAAELAPGELCPGWTALMVAAALDADAAFFWLLALRASDPSFVHGDPELLGRKAVDAAKASHTASIVAWGRSYGHFLGRYVLDGDPKHVSPTCYVIFAKDLDAGGTAVALKFMCDLAAFQREVDCRAGLDSATVISILAHHGGDTAKIPAEALTQFPQIRLSTEPAGQGTSLNLLLVMERGSSDLSDIISHADLAGKDMLRVRTIAISTAKCLQYLHSKGKMHGDLKPRNLVMLRNGEFGVIDLDAAATFDPTKARHPDTPAEERGWYLAGQKDTSSGCLPPEQAELVLHRLRRAASIFEHLAEGADELSGLALSRFYGDLGKGAPPKPAALDEDSNGQVSAVAFAAAFANLTYSPAIDQYFTEKGLGGALSSRDADKKTALEAERDQAFEQRDGKRVTGIIAQIDALEHAAAAGDAAPAAVIAHPSYDVWCFGVMLYELATGFKLFESNIREDVADAELAKIAEWSDAVKKQKLSVVGDKALRRLLDQLLQKDMARRLDSWDDIIFALENNGNAPRAFVSGCTSRDRPARQDQAWVRYENFYFTASNSDAGPGHDEVYRQNPRLEEAVGTADVPTAEIMNCIEGGGGKGERGETTQQRQAKHGDNKAKLALRMAEDLKMAESSENLSAVRFGGGGVGCGIDGDGRRHAVGSRCVVAPFYTHAPPPGHSP